MNNKTLKTLKRRWQLYVLLLPAVIYILLFVYKPMYGVLIAFEDFSLKKGVLGSKWVGFDNFRRLFSSYWFPIIMKNTLKISLLSLVLSFPFPIFFALMVNEIQNEKIKNGIQTISYAPHFISTVVVCGMLLLFLNPNTGIVNNILNLFGIESVFFMQKPDLFPWIYVLSGIWQEAGWGAIIYFSALSSVDKSLLEAAEIDGAGRIQRIIHINLPAIAPTIIVMFILKCGQLLGVGYEKVYLLQNATNLSGSEVISTYVYKTGLENFDFSFSTAAGLFNSVVNAVILLAVNKIANKLSGSGLW